ncbi:hypothetical protein [Streptomyces himalayensis]|uniref:Uncharacterized protein n=1 Tax=Streptomyces himalayensis subsp. himalayensis TaxID=2756131 RepID=A0A7W0IDW0_9ACTN|nr:hypothetical protein [Streptomyces himalayensis]MBA2951722.1 hypothetical protein [Streptomyces himalayensis subsp. himalayensis]
MSHVSAAAAQSPYAKPSTRAAQTVSILGVFGGVLDKVPLGATMNKGLTLRMGQQHGQRYRGFALHRRSRRW